MRVVPVLALSVVSVVLSAACAPATVSPSSADIARAFTLTVDGTPVPADGVTYSYSTEEFDLSAGLTEHQVVVSVSNKSDATMQIVPDSSVFVLPSGASSRVLTGQASYATRNNPQPVILVPADAGATTVLLPSALLGFESGRYGRGVYMDPIFPWPLPSRVTFRLVLRMEVAGEEREVTLLFEGMPLPSSDS